MLKDAIYIVDLCIRVLTDVFYKIIIFLLVRVYAKVVVIFQSEYK